MTLSGILEVWKQNKFSISCLLQVYLSALNYLTLVFQLICHECDNGMPEPIKKQ